MEYAVIALVSVLIGYTMGRQSTRDKQQVKEGRPIGKIKFAPDFVKQKVEADPILEGFANIMAYDGSEQE